MISIFEAKKSRTIILAFLYDEWEVLLNVARTNEKRTVPKICPIEDPTLFGHINDPNNSPNC